MMSEGAYGFSNLRVMIFHVVFFKKNMIQKQKASVFSALTTTVTQAEKTKALLSMIIGGCVVKSAISLRFQAQKQMMVFTTSVASRI